MQNISTTSIDRGAELIKYASNAFLATKDNLILTNYQIYVKNLGINIEDISLGMG